MLHFADDVKTGSRVEYKDLPVFPGEKGREGSEPSGNPSGSSTP